MVLRTRPVADVAVLLGGFWALVLVGGRLNEGYEQTRDYVSSLASYGAHAAWVGMLAIAVLAAAHAVSALLLARAGPRLAAGLLAGAAVSGLVTALARLTCPGGAAGCGLDDGSAAGGVSDLVHGLSVQAYAVLTVLAMLAVARAALREGDRTTAGLHALFAATSAAAGLLTVVSAVPGGWQRGWLAVNGAWLLFACWRARGWARG